MKNLRSAMAERAMTIMQVAVKSGLKHPVVSRAYNGKMMNPEYKTIAALGQGCDRQPWELIRPPGSSPTPHDHDLTECARRIAEAASRVTQDCEKKKRSADSNHGKDGEK